MSRGAGKPLADEIIRLQVHIKEERITYKELIIFSASGCRWNVCTFVPKKRAIRF